MKNQTEQLTPTSPKQTEAKVEVIKLGMDIHKRQYVVVQQVEGEGPKAPQRFTPESFLSYLAKLRKRAKRVITCYEAGCFGYVLHRQLEGMGIENLVVRPRNWDEYGSKVKTDGRDARELCSCLDRWLAGNKNALSVVRVPTEEQERSRSLSRQRETLAKELKRLQNIGQSNGRYYGIELKMSWWKPCRWRVLEKELPDWFVAIIAPIQVVLTTINAQLKEATGREERQANRKLPVGLGALTASVLDQEFRDYSRFSNRRQVASFTGLCPSEQSSGATHHRGSINKHGNPRIRSKLIEACWRLLQFQHDYEPIKQWRLRFAEQPPGKAPKKKMIVAIARRFAVDWWRINTGQIQPEDVGLRVDYPASYAAKALREGRIVKHYA
ncbi:IS110 family RNA-guided transposase [Puniceicoccus vermicola]|uniref:IS110 family transposase n=1 Tax=Puniceicoccus vermicola TaxID=388746 RepID=A0A7X1B1W0_9BACT|nr:IS110 family transposase [Puniceicoccus vermicola]MBC2602998.1 IS110 family transposase [Puniceicoccus vermicola]